MAFMSSPGCEKERILLSLHSDNIHALSYTLLLGFQPHSIFCIISAIILGTNRADIPTFAYSEQ